MRYLATLITSFSLLLLPFAAAADKGYSIESQSLSGALIAFAQQSQLQILFQVKELPNSIVPAFKGRHKPKVLLEHLLLDTGLTYRWDTDDLVLIEPIVLTTADIVESDIKVDAEFLPPLNYSDTRLEEIEVVGIRGSLKQSLQSKRQASSIVDVITAEGIGKFPDKNVADSLQRIPGISVDRIWGEGRDINIRGTDKDVNRTLMNGQNVASSYWWANDNPSRGFNYSILASELVSKLEVYKSPEADIDEGSIGGTVIIHTRRPLELESHTLQASIEGIYSELPDDWDPQGAVLGSWKNTQQSFGVLASLNYQSRTVRRDGLEAFPDNNLYTVTDTGGRSIDNVHIPWGMGSAIFQQQRERTTGNITVQWSPSESFELVFNSIYSNMDMDNQNQNYLSIPGGFKFSETPSPKISDYSFISTDAEEKTLSSATVGNRNSAGAAIDAIFRESYIETSVYDLDGNYFSDSWNLHWQLGVTRAEGGSDHDRLYRFVGNTREQYSLTGRTVEFSFPDLDPEQGSSLNQLSPETHDWIRRMEDEEYYAQLDYDWAVDIGWFQRFSIGAKWRDHSVENNRQRGEINTSHPDWLSAEKIGLDAVSNSLTPNLHGEAGSSGSLRRYAWVDGGLAKRKLDSLFEGGLMDYRYDRAAYYHIDENIRAIYWKGDFESGSWRGNIGVRGVSTQQFSEAWQGEYLIDHTRTYNDWLPSLNVVYQVADDFLVRAAAAKVMARPTFPNVTPSVIIDATDGTASGGNPDLEPFRAKQWELGGEWYFSPGSLLAATWFYKDMSTFVFTQNSSEVVDGLVVSVARPQNGPGADIQGLELQWQQDLSFGFGVQTNYTYTDAQVPTHLGIDSLSLPGNSRDQINASFYYEDEQLSTRLSWNYRSDSYGGFATGSQDVTEAYAQWDAALAWSVSEHIALTMEAVNLLNEVVYYRTANGIAQGIYENGRRFSIGVRLKL